MGAKASPAPLELVAGIWRCTEQQCRRERIWQDLNARGRGRVASVDCVRTRDKGGERLNGERVHQLLSHGHGESFNFTVHPCATFIGNYQESNGTRTGWGAVVLAEIIALIAAATVHRVCITTCFLFSIGLLYEVNKLSGMVLSKGEAKGKRYLTRW